MLLRAQAEQIAGLYETRPPQVGHPSTLSDPDKVQQFLAAISDGNYRETAAKLAGIPKSTLYNWLKLAEAGNEAAIAFSDALEKAEAYAESKAVRNTLRAGELPQFWAANMTYLERKYPEKWGRRQDDSSAPKVIVQIGIKDSDVSISTVSPQPSAMPERNLNE